MGHTNSLILAATLICLHGSGAWAQTSATTPQQTSTTAPQEDRLPVNIHGTIRSKYEYQTQENEGRFEVRNARVSVDGKLSPVIGYKAEIDLCDEGKIKMLDAYTRLKPAQGLQLTLGQMRVPFTIDAHRSPHQQYFANRSFIAKQVGNVRDVGFAAGYTIQAGFPIVLEAGLFNGSGLTNQKDFWTNSVNFSAKAQLLLPHGFGLVLSTQKIKPDDVDVMMYDAVSTGTPEDGTSRLSISTSTMPTTPSVPSTPSTPSSATTYPRGRASSATSRLCCATTT